MKVSETDKIEIGDIMYHDGYPIDRVGDLVKVRIDGFIEKNDLIKCSFFDEHFTNHVTTEEELKQITMSKGELDKLLELETKLTLMFDSDIRVGLALLEEIRKLKKNKDEDKNT